MKKIVIIGGGFFGLYLSEYLSQHHHQVLLVEREGEFMERASYNNQARVHNGYHYPRSVLTAFRSRVSFPRFVEEFSECIVSEFEKYYCIGRPLGKVTAIQFAKFCNKIGAKCEPAPVRFSRLVNHGLIEESFAVQEFAFDARILRDLMLRRLANLPITFKTGTEAISVSPGNRGCKLRVTLQDRETGGIWEEEADHVFNCTYSHLNTLLSRSQLEPIPLKHEVTEMCLVDVPEELKSVGATIMCGPFFSVMPFPSTGHHSFSHVRYTPHYEWSERPGTACTDPDEYLRPFMAASAWKHMQCDGKRYIPLLSECVYRDSLWEVKTVLPRSDTDDSRPILLRTNHGLPGLHCILGGKIDNAYDVIDALSNSGLDLS